MPNENGCVVRATGDGALSDIEGMSGHIILDETSSELQVGVGDGARRVGEGDQLG